MPDMNKENVSAGKNVSTVVAWIGPKERLTARKNANAREATAGRMPIRDAARKIIAPVMQVAEAG
jgi:hypothetical protein